MSRPAAILFVPGGAALALLTAAACASPPSRPAAELPAFEVPVVDLRTLPEETRGLALQAQRKAINAPADADAVGRLGLHYLTYDLHLASATCLERASALQPSTFKWLYYLALAREKAGDGRAAVRALERAVEIDPRYVPALVKLGDLLVETDPARAEGAYRRALALDPRDPRAHLGLGRCARGAGRGEAALEQFLEAAKIAPGYADAHYAAAMILSASGRREEAAEHLRRHAEGSDPPFANDPLRQELDRLGADSSYGLIEDAKRLMDAGRLEEAEGLLRRAVSTDVSGSVARTQLGAVLGLERRYAEAATEFQIVLEMDPGDAVARANLGRALEGMGRKEAAEREYRRVLEDHPDHADAHLYLGQLLARGEPTLREALEHLRRAVDLKPSDGEPRYYLGVTLAQGGDSDQAAAQLRRAVQLMPDHVGAWYTLGQVLLLSGDAAGAKEAWEESVRISPGFANGFAGLARIALEARDAASAVRWAEKACEAGRYSVAEHLSLLAAAYDAASRPADAAEMRRRSGGLGKPGGITP